jgi:hypothetical protein
MSTKNRKRWTRAMLEINPVGLTLEDGNVQEDVKSFLYLYFRPLCLNKLHLAE